MITKILYGPIELLPPIPVSRAILEVEGIKPSDPPLTTHVFLDDVPGENLERQILTHNHAGYFSNTDVIAGTVQLDITKALNRALRARPNFNISFLTQCTDEHETPVFEFKQLHIHKTPTMDTHPVTHTITPESFFKETANK
jgi:hypothetical protein